MNTRLPWFPMYVGDWLLSHSVRLMTPEQRGIYVQLLCEQWQNGGALPDDETQLQALAGATDEQWLRSKDVVLKNFEHSDGVIFNARLRQEMEGRKSSHIKLSEAGKRGMAKRWGTEAPERYVITEKSAQKTTAQIPEAAVRLASLLKAEILRNKPDCRITSGQERVWEMVADKMMRVDKRSEEKIGAVIKWAQGDEFWKSNALSMHSIRRNFDQLEMKSRNGGGNSAPMVNPADVVRAELEREQ
jgi:uncharacterized protein YdaU (DUF1376 family)